MNSAEQILAELYRLVLEAGNAQDEASTAAVAADTKAKKDQTPENIHAAMQADLAFHRAFDAKGTVERRYSRARTAFLKGEDIASHAPEAQPPAYTGKVHNATPADSRVLEAIAGGPVEVAVMNTAKVQP